jgi:hypothetical protein
MPAPLLRKKPSAQLDMFDPVSAAAWSAGATATAAVVAVVDLLALSHAHSKLAKDLTAQLEAATALTPCAVKREARTKPRKRWGFQDYILTVQVCEGLRSVIVDGCDQIPQGQFALFDATRETAAQAIIAFIDPIEAYAKLVKRERAMERLSGNESLRRGLVR